MVDKTGYNSFNSDQARTIRIPVHMIETINKIVELKQIMSEFGREPAEELAKN